MRVLFVTMEWPFEYQPYRGPFAKALADGLHKFIEVVPLPLPIKRNPLNILKYRPVIRKQFANHHCGHIHCYSFNSLLLVNPEKYPVSATAIGSDVMGLVDQNGNYSLKGKLLYFLLKRKIKHLKGIRCVSDQLKEKIQKDLVQDIPVTVLPDGIDLNRFSAKDREIACRNLGWDPGCINVYFPGNPERGVKNYALAQRLIAEAQKYLNVCLHTFPGVAPHEISDYYWAADLVLITSIHEGSSNSLKEALLCNTPVLSTPVGDAPYWLEKNACGSIIDFKIGQAEFLEKLCHYSQIKRKQEPSRNQAIAEEIDLHKTAKKFSEFLKAIA